MTTSIYVTTAAIREDTEFNGLPYRNGVFDVSTAQEVDRQSALFQAVRKGDRDAKQQMPKRLFRVGKALLVGPLKSVTVAGGNFLILRGDVAVIFEKHEIGDAELMPVQLIDCDNETPINADARLLLPGSYHRTIDHASSHLMKNRYARPPRYRLPNEPDKLADLKVIGSPRDDLALWWDDTIDFAIFLNGALARDIQSAGLNDHLQVTVVQ